jgi:hypothetical protein
MTCLPSASSWSKYSSGRPIRPEGALGLRIAGYGPAFIRTKGGLKHSAGQSRAGGAGRLNPDHLFPLEGTRVNTSKDQILQLLESQGNHEQAQQAAQQLLIRLIPRTRTTPRSCRSLAWTRAVWVANSVAWATCFEPAWPRRRCAAAPCPSAVSWRSSQGAARAVSALMRDEVKLAQLEMTRKGKQTGGGEDNDQVVVQAGGHAG